MVKIIQIESRNKFSHPAEQIGVAARHVEAVGTVELLAAVFVGLDAGRR